MKKIIVPIIVAIIVSTGCVGNIVKGPTQKVSFNSSPTGAEVTIDGVFEGVTPLSLELIRRESHHAVISLAGYEDAKFDIHKSLSGTIIVSDILIFGAPLLYLLPGISDGRISGGDLACSVLLFAGTALVFDYISGGMYNLNPSDISSSLTNVAVTGSIVDISLNPIQ